MSGRYSRNKGARGEYDVRNSFQEHGFAAEKLSRMYRLGPDISVPFLGADRMVEVKTRKSHAVSKWLTPEVDILVLKEDRKEKLVVMRWSFAMRAATLAELQFKASLEG